jgi:hypothetical protein
MICTKRLKLLEQYGAATEKRSQLLRELATGTNQRCSYEEAWNECEQARLACVELQEGLAAHLREHSCGGADYLPFSCRETVRQLAEQFAIAARLYGDAVVELTRDWGNSSSPKRDYDGLRSAAVEAQERAEAAGMAFELLVEQQRSRAQQSTARQQESGIHSGTLGGPEQGPPLTAASAEAGLVIATTDSPAEIKK